LRVEKIEETETIEKFRAIAQNQSFVLPAIITKRLKYFPIKWKVFEGGYHHQYILDLITREIAMILNIQKAIDYQLKKIY
jgi:hypothetical protein